jgi:hypothetical protein
MYPGGAHVQAGDHIYVFTRLEKSILGDVAFVTPSPVMLALDAAIRAAKEAVALRGEIRVESTGQPNQPPSVPPKQLPELYRFFEYAMIAVTFSYQALEAFANEIVTNELKGSVRLVRGAKTLELNAAEVERKASTEEKLGVIVPNLLKAKSPKSFAAWQGLKHIKGIRDATIHLKSIDQYVRGKPDDQTLYFRLLNTDPLSFPRAAIAMLEYFSPANPAILGAQAQL